MIFLIDNYETTYHTQSLYLHTAFDKMGHQSVMSNFAANSVFDLFDTVKPEVVITSALRLSKDILFYFSENKDLGIKLLLNVDNIKEEDLIHLKDYMASQGVVPNLLFTSNYSLPDKIGRLNVLKLLPAADDNQVQSLDFDYNIDKAIITDSLNDEMKYSSSFHVVSMNPDLNGKADICLPCVGIRSIYDKYNEIIFKDMNNVSQGFFDALRRGKKVYYQNKQDTGIQEKINKIFKIDCNLDYSSEKKTEDFSQLKEIVAQKHTGDNRAKTILSQVKGTL
jgi:hypothetical protein